MKYLVLLIVVVVAVGLWRSRRAADTRAQQAGSTAPARPVPLPQAVLACAQCGVHVPHAEAVMAGSDAYCCAEHRRLGPR